MGGDNRDAFSSPRKKGGSCRRIPFELRTGMPRKEIALQTKEGTEGKYGLSSMRICRRTCEEFPKGSILERI
jgi:hypothetical protein